MTNSSKPENFDVIVIGAGPSGLATATALKKSGVKKVLVLDREAEAGGVPRHCGHISFGMIEYLRPMTGPDYAWHLARTANKNKVALYLKTSVTGLAPGGLVTAVTPCGPKTFKGTRVVLATGARETPRSARLISGGRMMGISTTGALQSMVYLNHQIPFRRPVIVGSEMVSLSALMTCKKAGIQPVAVLEQAPSPQVPWPLGFAPRFFRVPLHKSARVTDISGNPRVAQVQFSDKKGREKTLDCDGILFTGQFTPESTLVRSSHLRLDPDTSSPETDLLGRCSDPAYFAVGNLLPPLNMAMNCWRAGKKLAKILVRDMVETR